jgi:hypothetical protein
VLNILWTPALIYFIGSFTDCYPFALAVTVIDFNPAPSATADRHLGATSGFGEG